MRIYTFGRGLPISQELSKDGKLIIGTETVDLSDILRRLELQKDDVLVYVLPVFFNNGKFVEVRTFRVFTKKEDHKQCMYNVQSRVQGLGRTDALVVLRKGYSIVGENFRLDTREKLPLVPSYCVANLAKEGLLSGYYEAIVNLTMNLVPVFL